MRKMEVALATAPLSEYARDVRREPVLLTRHGRPFAALVPIRGGDPESFSLASNPKFRAILERSWARYRKEGGVSAAEVRRRLGLPPRRGGKRIPA